MSTHPRILDLGAALTLITALIYTAGWSYAYHWYERFELGLIGLDIPFEYHFMYGFWVLQSFWWLILAVAGMVALTYWARVDPVLDLFARTMPVWVPLTFLLIYQLGAGAVRLDYQAHREAGFDHYPLVRIWTTLDPDDAPARLRDLPQDLAADNYRLLLQTAHSLYLIRPDRDGGEIPTLQLPRDRIRALRRIPTNPGR